ncbi:hypothetical protein D3C74_352990 [compost metagenome]
MQPQERDIWVATDVMGYKADRVRPGMIINSKGHSTSPAMYSTNISAAIEVMEKFRNPVGMKVAFGFLLKEVAEAVQDRHSIHPMSLIWYMNPENICLAALLTQGEGIEREQ